MCPYAEISLLHGQRDVTGIFIASVNGIEFLLAVFTALTLQSKSNKDFLPLTGAVFSIKYLKLMDKCAELELNLVIASSKILPISACPIGLVCHFVKIS